MDIEIEHKIVEKKYKSPKGKLVRFFENSRDKWKTKAKDAKYQVKLLRKKNKYVEQKKNEFKEHSKELEIQLEQMKAAEEQLHAEIDQLKKKLRYLKTRCL